MTWKAHPNVMRLAVAMLALCSANCDGAAPADAAVDAPPDAQTPTDAAPAPGLDAGPVSSRDAGSASGARQVCEAVDACAPAFELEQCISSTQALIDRSAAVGCTTEVEMANGCSARVFGEVSGTCDGTEVSACDAEFDALISCLRDGGETVDFGCDTPSGPFRRCVEYVGNANGPDAACGLLGADVVASCSRDSLAGTCVVSARDGVSVTFVYYDPLPMGFSLPTLEAGCMGAWTTGG